MTGADQRRVEELAEELGRRYPDSVAVCGEAIELVAQDGFDSPEWCWLPMVAFALCTTAAVEPWGVGLLDISSVAALTQWQLGRGVYRPDPELVDGVRAVLHESAGIELGAAEHWSRGKPPPLDAWTRLPEWCCYVTMPAAGPRIDGVPDALGVFVHLEYDPETARPELRLLVDCDGTWAGLIPLSVALDRPDLGAALGETELAMRESDPAAADDVRNLYGPYASRHLLGMLTWSVLPLAATLIAPEARFGAVDGTPARPERARPRGGAWAPAAATRLWRIAPGPCPSGPGAQPPA